MRLRLLSLLALLVSFATQALAQTQATPPVPGPALTLEEAVAMALAQNFDIKIQRITTESAKDNLIIADAAFDPNLNVNARKNYNRSTSGGSFVDDEGNVIPQTSSSQDNISTSAGVSQRLVTGTNVQVNSSLDRSHSNPSRSNFNPAYDSDISLTVRQSLLRNFGIAVNRAGIDRARLGVTRAGFDLKSAVLTIVRNVETAYYNVAFARVQVDVRRFSLEVAQKLLDENRTRQATGVATNLDVLLAEVTVANARRALLQAEQTVQDREDALIAMIQPFGFNTAIGPLFIPEIGPLTTSFDHSYKLARDNAPDLASTQLSIEQLKLDAVVAKKNRLPTLDIGGTLGYSAREDAWSRASSRTLNGDNYVWQLDATLSLPIGLRADKARYRQSLSSLSREQVRLQQIDQNLLVQVRSAIRAVTINDESVRISALASQLSEQQFELEKTRYDNGLSTFRRVQEAQEDLDNSRIAELQSKVNLRNALADLSRLEATSLERYKIKLEQ